MLAAVYHGRRDVRLEEVPDPNLLSEYDVRLEIRRVALCGTDAGEYAHGPRMIPLHSPHPGSGHVGPMVLGHEIVGEVVEVGPGVSTIRPGQLVVPGAGMWCGSCRWCRAGATNLCAHYYTLGLNANGGLTSLLDVPERMCCEVPTGCSIDAAAMAQPFAVALHAVDRANVTDADTVVLIGVGGIGLFLLAGLLERTRRVVAIDIEHDRLRTARELGALAAIDGRDGQLAERVSEALDGEPVDRVVEASGAPASPALAQRLVRRGGRIVVVGLQAAPRELDISDLVLREVELVTSVAHICSENLPVALSLLAGGQMATQALDRVIPLEAVVEEGLEPLAAGTVAGKVVVAPAGQLSSNAAASNTG